MILRIILRQSHCLWIRAGRNRMCRPAALFGSLPNHFMPEIVPQMAAPVQTSPAKMNGACQSPSRETSASTPPDSSVTIRRPQGHRPMGFPSIRSSAVLPSLSISQRRPQNTAS